MSCSRTQHSDSNESLTSDPSIPSLRLYQLSHCASLTPDRRQSKMLILSTNVDKKSLETEFLIAICRLAGDKWQSKTLFLGVFYPPSSIVKRILNCRLSGV